MENSIENDGDVCEPAEVDEQEMPAAGDSEVLEVLKDLKVFLQVERHCCDEIRGVNDDPFTVTWASVGE